MPFYHTKSQFFDTKHNFWTAAGLGSADNSYMRRGRRVVLTARVSCQQVEANLPREVLMSIESRDLATARGRLGPFEQPIERSAGITSPNSFAPRDRDPRARSPVMTAPRRSCPDRIRLHSTGFVVLLLLLLTVVGCAVYKPWIPTGGSRADGIVRLSIWYTYGQLPQVSAQQGLEVARARCQAWDYQDAQAFGGSISACTQYASTGNCVAWVVSVHYQCVVRTR